MWQPVLMVDGFILCILALSMFFPAMLDVYDLQASWSPFFSTALITLFIGLILFLSNKSKINKLSLRQGYLITFCCWVSVAIFSSLPFIFIGTLSDVTAAFFESV